MRLKDQLLLVAETYCRATGMKDGRLSTVVFGSGDKFKRLRAGKGMISCNIENAIQDLSDRWPEGAAWPEPVPRPAPRAETAVTRTTPGAGSSPAPEAGGGPGGVVA